MTKVVTRDDFTRRVFEAGLQFPIGADAYNRIASESGFLIPLHREEGRGPTKELRELDEEIERLNVDYGEATAALGQAQLAAEGSRVIVVSLDYQQIEPRKPADIAGGRQKVEDALAHVATVSATHQLAVERRSRLLAREARASSLRAQAAA